MKDRKTPGSQRPQQVPKPVNQPRDSLPWRALEQQVVRMQKQIAQAAQRGDKQAVHDLQQRLMESEAARLLAVRRVAIDSGGILALVLLGNAAHCQQAGRVAEENQGKDTAGVDGIKSLSPQERLAMASTIHPKYWNYQPPCRYDECGSPSQGRQNGVRSPSCR